MKNQQAWAEHSKFQMPENSCRLQQFFLGLLAQIYLEMNIFAYYSADSINDYWSISTHMKYLFNACRENLNNGKLYGNFK